MIRGSQEESSIGRNFVETGFLFPFPGMALGPEMGNAETGRNVVCRFCLPQSATKEIPLITLKSDDPCQGSFRETTRQLPSNP
jgi:hypothetical protein